MVCTAGLRGAASFASFAAPDDDGADARHEVLVSEALHACRRLRRALRALTEMLPVRSDVLKRYGVPQEDHAALVKELAPLISTAFGAAKPAKLERLDVTVTRGESGGLGIDVDKSNVIAVVRGQPQLQVGDRVLAVNGEELGGKFLAQALPPGQPAYVFTVERGGGGSTAALEATVFELLDSDELLSTSAPALATLDVSRPAAVKLAKAAANLEEAGGALDRADDEMMSFWKLVFTNDADFLKAGGASGLGQCFQDKAPRGQTVEIIANTNLGTHTIAALKGDFTLGPSEQREGVGTCRTVNEVYESTKYQGALLTSKILKRECVLTYLGDQVAVKRGTGGQGGGVFIYKRLSQADASKDIQAWTEKAVPGVAMVKPRWEQDGAGGPSADPGSRSSLRD